MTRDLAVAARRRPKPSALPLLLIGTLVAGLVVLVAPAPAALAQAAPAAGVYVPLTPARIFNTQAGGGGIVAAQTTRDVQVAGVPGSGVPTTDVLAVVLDLTVYNSSGGAWGILWQAGIDRPYPASSINYVPGRNVTNTVTTKLGVTGAAVGKVSFFTWEATDMLIDVVGYYRTAPGGGGYVPLTQNRILNTNGAKVAANTSFDQKLRGGVTGVPDSSTVTAVVVNATVYNETAGGYLTLWPKGLTRPVTSAMSFPPARAHTNMVVATLSGDGYTSVFTSDSVDMIIDVVGYYTTGSNATFVPLTPERLIDTRHNGTRYNNVPNWGIGPITAPLAANTTTTIKVAGEAGVPAGEVSTVILNVVADAATTATSAQVGFLTVWASGDTQPGTFAMTYYGTESTTNLVMAKVGTDGKVNIHNYYASTELLVDVVGYFTTGVGPGAPTNVIAAPADQAATLAWGPPASDGGTAIAGYMVKVYKTTPTLTYVSETTTCATCTSTTLAGLINGQEYRFEVFARNSLGYGSPATSNAVTAGGSADLLRPTSVEVTPGDGGGIVTWTRPAVRLEGLTAYTVNAYAESNPTLVVASATVTDPTSTATLVGLSNGERYIASVTATTLAVISAESARSAPFVPAGRPSAPVEVAADPGDHQAIVYWQPAGDNGSPITGYEVVIFANDQAVGTQPVAATQTSAVVGNLANGSATYSFAVRAINAVDSSVDSARSNSVVPAGRPFAPQFVGGSAVDSDEISLSWVAPLIRDDGTPGNNGSALRWYTVLVSPACPGCQGVGVPADNLATARTTIRGLAPGTSYTFRVTATNSLGTSDSSSPSAPVTTPTVNPTPEPGHPGPATIVNVIFGDGTATVTWTLADPMGSPITEYTATAIRADGSEAARTTLPGSPTSATLGGLSNTAAYTFQVVARNGVGDSAIASSQPGSLRSIADRYMVMPLDEFQTAKSQPQPPFTWTDDDCSTFAGRQLPAEFRPACERHDFGYRNYGIGLRLGDNEDTRFWIDQILLQDWRAICEATREGVDRNLCMITAEGSYDFIRWFGGGEF